MKYKTIIGLEVHVELNTKSKMFCSCLADYFNKKPNTHTCPVCLGLPGTLPVPNKKAVESCIMIGLALNCKIALFSKFDRKNYFYPDLPKGYQISQYDEPFCYDGEIKIKDKTVKIKRVHMEEDTAKLSHKEINGKKVSLIDFNRSGIPLAEIVTEPDFENALEVKEYLQKLHQLVRYLDVSNADMEKGDMRLEPNISLQKSELKELPKYKVEVKNINSFSFVEKAIEYEMKRQTLILDRGEVPLQETRGWDEKKHRTFSQRIKEEANDYRYFPEPDIPPIRWIESQISNLKSQMPEFPDSKLNRFKKEYSLLHYDAEILTRHVYLANYFEEAVKEGQKTKLTPKQIANYIINKKININNILPAKLIEEILTSSKIEGVGVKELKTVIQKVLKNNPKIAKDYKKGKENVIQFAMGQVMYIIRKRIDAEILRKLILEELK